MGCRACIVEAGCKAELNSDLILGLKVLQEERLGSVPCWR